MPHNEVLSTPLIDAKSISAGSFSVYSEISIDALPDDVFKALLDFDKYPEWNSFTPTAKRSPSPGQLAVNDKVKISVSMTGGPAFMRMSMQITTFDVVERSLSWKTISWPDWLLRAERVFKVNTKDDRSEFLCYETQTGPLAFLVKLCVGSTLDKAFARFGQDLKHYVESLQ